MWEQPKKMDDPEVIKEAFVESGLDADKLRKQVQKDHNVVLAGGYGPQQGKIFRIGHLGYVKPKEIDETIDALDFTLKSF